MLPSGAADVGDAHGRRVTVAEVEKSFAGGTDGGGLGPAGTGTMLSEPVGGLKLEPGPAALFLVRRDAVPADGAHGGQPQQGARRVLERFGAVFTQVDADRFVVQVPAIPAAAG